MISHPTKLRVQFAGGKSRIPPEGCCTLTPAAVPPVYTVLLFFGFPCLTSLYDSGLLVHTSKDPEFSILKQRITGRMLQVPPPPPPPPPAAPPMRREARARPGASSIASVSSCQYKDGVRSLHSSTNAGRVNLYLGQLVRGRRDQGPVRVSDDPYFRHSATERRFSAPLTHRPLLAVQERTSPADMNLVDITNTAERQITSVMSRA